LRSARALRVEFGLVIVVVSVELEVDPFMLEPLLVPPVALELLELPELLESVLLPVLDEPLVLPELVDEFGLVLVLPVGPERTIPPGVVVEVEPAFGPDVELLLLGEPDAPPWPPPLVPEPVPVPVCASAKPPPHAKAAARVRILVVCLMHFSWLLM
jgi:hypothetical protein